MTGKSSTMNLQSEYKSNISRYFLFLFCQLYGAGVFSIIFQIFPITSECMLNHSLTGLVWSPYISYLFHLKLWIVLTSWLGTSDCSVLKKCLKKLLKVIRTIQSCGQYLRQLSYSIKGDM